MCCLGMVKELTGGYKIKYHANGQENDPIEIDFTPPFRSRLVCSFSVKARPVHPYIII